MSVAAGQRIPRDKIATETYRTEGAKVTNGQTFTEGWSMMRAAAGTLQIATEVPTLLPGGFADRDLILADPNGNDFVNAWTGIFAVDMSGLAGDAFADTDKPAPIYAIDNQLFGKLPTNPSTGAQRSIAGLFLRVDRPLFGSKCLAWIGPEGYAMAQALQIAQGVAVRDRARVVFTNLGGTTTYANGVMTGPANTTLPTQDGVVVGTAAGQIGVGDILWAPKGLTNLPAAAQAGPWQILSVGSGSSQWTAARPWWWATGSVMPIDAQIRIGPEGTGVLASTIWMNFSAQGKIVDTDDPLFWPQSARVAATLGAGGVTPAITTIPIKAWPGSRITFTPTTLASDGTVTLWRPTSVTGGPLGTATFTVTGESAAGTAVAGARTVGMVEVQNW